MNAIARSGLSIVLTGWLVLVARPASAERPRPAPRPGWAELIGERGLAAWRAPTTGWFVAGDARVDPENSKRLVGTPGKGTIVNGPIGRARNLFSRDDYGDVEIHVEFLVPRGSNSGVKFQGLYEIQIHDSFGVKKPTAHHCGGIYPRAELKPKYHYLDDGVPPRVNACKPPGEWQTLDAVFRAPRFDAQGKKIADARLEKAVLNGQVVHENVVLRTPTGHAWPKKEVARGPLMLQADHGPVAFRNVRARPLNDGPRSSGAASAAKAKTNAKANASTRTRPKTSHRPNVLLILTDDQGYGDFGFTGNPKVQTPNIDRLARESVSFQRFYVSPVCSLTRASLMTGRYAYRTGVVDTFMGRSLMAPDERTLAELLGAAGYRTGIFGKWHLGDNAPLRPIDQGFEEALVIRGGGLRQAANPPGGDGYSNPILEHNGKAERRSGYCSDIYTDAAIEFIEKPGDERPFFAYLAFNCPHTPLDDVPENELAIYRKMDLAPSAFPALGHAVPPEQWSKPDDIARVYAMVTNIDTNVGRALRALEAGGLARDTIVVFLTDNGPQQVRFNAGLRGRKGTVYDAGIHVPCLVRWPARLKAGKVVDRLAAHIDIVPTLLEACGVAPAPGPPFDGKSLMPLLTGPPAEWPERTLFFQWHRGDVPQMGRAFVALAPRYAYLRREGPIGAPASPPLELFDTKADPWQERDIAAEKPEIAQRLDAAYRAWFQDVSATRGYGPVRIAIGDERENPTVLTRQDWRGPRAGWGPHDLGRWEVNVARAGRFDVKARLHPRPFPTVARLSLGGVEREARLDALAKECLFQDVPWKAGPARLEFRVEGNHSTAGALDLVVRRRDGER